MQQLIILLRKNELNEKIKFECDQRFCNQRLNTAHVSIYPRAWLKSE